MGSVWLAHHEKIEMSCAVKFIHADVADAAGVRERFEREAKVAGQLKSPHVVQVLDYGVSGDTPYIAMEFLEGEDLAKRLDARGRLSPEESVTIVAQVARALTKAHGAGLVHRDLKPENVFLVKDDDHEIVKVLDFGIAKANTPIDAKTKTGALMGTPRYMSPEQAQGQKNVDQRSDLWSLGVIAYRCVVGALPFDSDAIGDLMMRIIVHPLPIPSQILPGIPTSFDAFWLRAAARDPAHRFQSAKELAEALATSFGHGVPQGATAGATPMHGDSGGFSRAPSGHPSPSGGRAYTPASSQPLPAAMIGAPTVMPDGRSREGLQSASSGPPAFTPPSNFPPPSSTPQAYAPQAFGGQQLVAQTLGPASRTFNAPLKKKSSALPIVVAIIALAAGAGGAAFGIRAMSASAGKADAPARPTSVATQPAPPTTEAPHVEVAPAPDPSSSPTGSAATDAQQEAPPQAQTQKPSTKPRSGKLPSPPSHPPAPARSGKVRIQP